MEFENENVNCEFNCGDLFNGPLRPTPAPNINGIIGINREEFDYVFAPILCAVVIQFIGLNNGVIGYVYGALLRAFLTTQIGFIKGVIEYIFNATGVAIVVTNKVSGFDICCVCGYYFGFDNALTAAVVVATLAYIFEGVLTPGATGFEFEYGTAVPPVPFDIVLKFVEKERTERFEYGVQTPPATDNDNCFDNVLQSPPGAVSIILGFFVCVVGYCFNVIYVSCDLFASGLLIGILFIPALILYYYHVSCFHFLYMYYLLSNVAK